MTVCVGRAALAAMLVLGACGRSPVLVPEVVHLCSAEGPGFFAQVVLDYDPTAGGGERPASANPQEAIGPPELATPPHGAVSLGNGGTITLGFGACVITTDGSPDPDLVIYEQGYSERVAIALLPTTAARVWLDELVDDDGWIAIDEQAYGDDVLDLDAQLGTLPRAALRFEAIRLRDVPGQGEVTPDTPGADLDAVEATQPRLAD